MRHLLFLSPRSEQVLTLQKPFEAAGSSQNILTLNSRANLVAMEVFLTRAEMTDEMQTLQCITARVPGVLFHLRWKKTISAGSDVSARDS